MKQIKTVRWPPTENITCFCNFPVVKAGDYYHCQNEHGPSHWWKRNRSGGFYAVNEPQEAKA